MLQELQVTHSMKRFSFGLPILLAACFWGQPAAAQIHQTTLPNGMTVIVKPDRRAPTAVHMVWLRVGSMDEVDGTSGVAHVLEHMLFKGTPSVGAGEFSRRVAALGGRENAFTSKDYTGYFQQIPASRLEDVMKLEADRFTGNQWPDEEFRKEIEVVKEERRMRTEDEPRALLHEAPTPATGVPEVSAAGPAATEPLDRLVDGEHEQAGDDRDPSRAMETLAGILTSRRRRTRSLR